METNYKTINAVNDADRARHFDRFDYGLLRRIREIKQVETKSKKNGNRRESSRDFKQV